MPITYPAAQDAKSIAVVRHRSGPSWHRIPAPQPRTPVVVFLPPPSYMGGRSLELGQLPASVGSVQLHAPAPRLPVVWIARAYRSTVVGGLAAVACGLDRGGVG